MRLIHETTSLCRVCKEAVPACVVERAGRAVMTKRCAAHGEQEVELSDDAAWYEEQRAVKPAPAPPRAVKEIALGCPFDCGPCTAHEQRIRLPVVTITSACNLDCPICYVHNKNEGAYHMPLEDFSRILDHLGPDADIVNLTGGEPMLHPRFLDFLRMAKERGVHRVTICSNGMLIAKNEPLVKELAGLNARIALSFDTFDEQADVLMQGVRLLPAKLKTLELCEKHGVDVTLIPVMTKGVNDGEIGKILELAFRSPAVRHVEVHTITFTGQGGVDFDRRTRISLRETLARIEEQTHLERSDFVPSPHAHGLCYQIAYLLVDPDGGPPVPFARFLDRTTIDSLMKEHLYLEPSRALEDALTDAIARLYAEGEERTLGILRKLLDSMFAPGLTREQALRAGERAAKAIYVHSHMDEETFDVERLAQCCDSNCYADGTSIPVCAYNVLYREKEAAFVAAPKEWTARKGARLPVIA